MKAIRKTYLTCGLLTVPVKIYAAVESERDIHFNLCGPDGEPAEQINVLAEDPRVMYAGRKKEWRGRRLVEQFEYGEMGRAYKGVQLDPESLTRIEEDSMVDEDGNDLNNLMVERFIPIADIPWERAKGLYFVGPDMIVSGKPFETFKAALKRRKVAGIAKVVMNKRQMLLALFERNSAVYALHLRFAEEMRSRDEEGVDLDLIDSRFKARSEEVKKMTELIDAYTVEATEVDKIRDTYVDSKRALVEDVIAGSQPRKRKKRSAPEPNDDLMEALQKSIKRAKGKGKVKV